MYSMLLIYIKGIKKVLNTYNKNNAKKWTEIYEACKCAYYKGGVKEKMKWISRLQVINFVLNLCQFELSQFQS